MRAKFIRIVALLSCMCGEMVLFLLLSLPLVTGYVITYKCPEMCLCDSEITSCQDNEFSQLPDDIDLNVVSLDLSFNSFQTFPSGMSSFSDLRYLNLSHNHISTLKFSDLEGLERLERLDLTFNYFHDWKDMHSSTFLPTKNLQFLDLSNNPLRSLPKYSNHLYIESLRILRLTNCSMKSIPVNVFNRLTNLVELYLSENPIGSLNETFKLENLKVMDLSRCRLSYLDENVFAGMPNLEMLIMRGNIHLRRFICNSNSLVYLDLAGSMLEKVPTGNLRALNRIDLSGNFLKTIPNGSFGGFYSLQVLNLSTNAITSIHEQAFDGLAQVISIDLSFNKLTMLSEKLFLNNSVLTYLNLSHNYIKSLDTISSKSLKMLTASYCEISELNRYSLELMPNLVTLTLARNYLTTLPNKLMGRSLVVLDVSSCRIRAITNETFEEMFYLRQINLASNSLTTIDPSFFPRAFNVQIKDNPWRCDCNKLKRMFEWMTTYTASRLNDLICNSPEKVEGKTWEQACTHEWYPNHDTKDTMWYYSLGIVIAMIVALFGLVILRKVKSLQEKRLRLEEETRRAEERETLRRMQERQREIEEEEDRNAPDPRELQRPPSYNEAILLPRVDASHPSLAGSMPSLNSNTDGAKKQRIRRKRRRRKSEEERRASRLTLDSDSSDQDQYKSMDSLPASRRKAHHAPPLESDF